MNALGRNALALILGVVAGSAVNMGLILYGPIIIPAPAGVDVNSVESITANLHLYQPIHFVVPFLAHALGTLVGAIVAYLTADANRKILAYAIGGVFLLGGIYASTIIPAPLWFVLLDLLGAYLPMAWLGILLAVKLSKPASGVNYQGDKDE